MADVPRFERKTAFRVTGPAQARTVGAGIINFDTIIYDLGSNFDLATDSYVAPLDGIYHFDGYYVAQAAATADGRFNVSIMVNSVEHTKGQDESVRGMQINDIHSRQVSGDLLLNRGDIVQLRASNVSGPTQNILAGSALLFFTGSRLQYESRTILN